MANEDHGKLDHRIDLQNNPNDDLVNPKNGLNIESDNDEPDELRKEVVERVNDQKIVLVGPEGSGKSSLINTFSMVLHLTDPTYQWMVWAAIRKGKTGRYNKNLATHCRKYSCLPS
jgi:ABC-type transport system involved in cytochrome bd biosynthesis fused ATPase/permease subunit